MIHERERLTFRFESGNDAPGVHAQLDDLDARHGAEPVRVCSAR